MGRVGEEGKVREGEKGERGEKMEDEKRRQQGIERNEDEVE